MEETVRLLCKADHVTLLLGRVTVGLGLRLGGGQTSVAVTFCGLRVTRLRVCFLIGADKIKGDRRALAEVCALLSAILINVHFIFPAFLSHSFNSN